MINDPPIHLRRYPYFIPQLHTDDSVTIPVWLTQSSLDGLNALIHYCEGVENSGKGRVPGSFELIMFYRTIRDCLEKAIKEQEKKETRLINVENKLKDTEERLKQATELLKTLLQARDAKETETWFDYNYRHLCEMALSQEVNDD